MDNFWHQIEHELSHSLKEADEHPVVNFFFLCSKKAIMLFYKII
jgi:hypothetical protein